MKRELEEISNCMGSSELVDHGQSHIALANCLMLLSRSQGYNCSNATARVFECKTCNKKFTSFQALGGHRASHKKPRLSSDHDHHQDQSSTKANKTTTHECSICGVEFAVGQALGGHMRKHRGALNDVNQSFVPIVKKPNGKRVLWMDLNLTPSENIHLHLRKPTPNFSVNLI